MNTFHILELLGFTKPVAHGNNGIWYTAELKGTGHMCYIEVVNDSLWVHPVASKLFYADQPDPSVNEILVIMPVTGTDYRWRDIAQVFPGTDYKIAVFPRTV